MDRLYNIFSAVCRPNPKAFPDEEQFLTVFNKNKFIFGVHLTILLIHSCSLPFIDYKAPLHIARFLTQIFVTSIFMIFCRSYPTLGQTINTFLVNLISMRVMHFGPDGAYTGLPYSYAIPIMIFYITQNVKLTSLTMCVQFSALALGIRANLIEAISFTDPEIFAEKFIAKSLPVTVLLQSLNLYVVYRLNSKTSELSKATRKAEQALEEQKTFVYSFSHEMRNPMNSLLGNLDLALMGEITPDVREMINTAKICGVLLLNLINTVLDAGKLSLGKLEVNPVPSRVHDIFQRTWALSHDLISRKGLKSHLKVSREVPPRLILDSHRLNQVLMNLIGNATKFTEYGCILMSVNWLHATEVSDQTFQPVPFDVENEGIFEKEYNLYAMKRANTKATEQSLLLSGGVREFSLEGVCQPVTESKGVLKIVIKDTGCGMSPEELSKLFQKFSQVGQVTRKRQIGTGLGLYISKEIIENMGGQIRAYSKPKIGSAFVICIPTTALPIQSQTEQFINTDASLLPKLRSKGFKTIIADDSAFNVSLVCNYYAKIGVEVLATASNGQVAYEKYIEIVKNGSNIDIITLDIDMPIMNGKEVCEKIREYERENGLKRSIILLISGNYEEEDMHTLLSKENENRPDCFLKKPLVFEELCWTVYKFGCLYGRS